MNIICRLVGRRPWRLAALAVLGLCVPGPRPARAADGDKGKATAEYLQRVKAVEEEGYSKGWGRNDLQGKIDAVRGCADKMDDLSARGVDEEAADLVDARVKLMKRIADYEDDSPGYGTG